MYLFNVERKFPLKVATPGNKAEKNFLVHDIGNDERAINCFCVKDDTSMMGKLIWVIGISLTFGIVSSLFLSIRIVKARSKLAALRNNTAENLRNNQNKK